MTTHQEDHATHPESPSPQQARRMMIAGLESEISSLARLDARKRWIEILFFPALWAIGAALTLQGLQTEHPILRIALCLAGIAASAVALNAFVLLVHEGMHGVLFANRYANRWMSVLFGSFVLIGFSAYKVMHLRHHRYLGDPRDPDDYDNYSRSRRVVWMLHLVRLTIGCYLYILLIPILASRYGRPRQRRDILVEYAVLLTFWTAVFWLVPLHYLFYAWLIPVVCVACMTSIRGFSQHGIADAHDPFLASRSMHPNPVISFLLLHENLHLEHHLFPEIPSYNLSRVHSLIAPRLPRAVTGRSYLAFVARFLALTFSRSPQPIIGLTVSSAPAATGADKDISSRPAP